MQRRKWSYEEKTRIVGESFSDGADSILKRYNISSAMLYGWKISLFKRERFDEADRSCEAVLIQLRSENEQLRKIVARQALELSLRTELINNSSY